MQINITVLSATRQQATAKSGKPYSFVELAYKGDDGSVKGKKVMPFGESKAVHDALAQAQGGDVYTITAIKNEGTGYWDWTQAVKSNGTSTGAVNSSVDTSSRPAAGGKVTGSNYETSEERAKKQVYIVRQSSIASAISFLTDSKKSATVENVIDTAKQFEKYVFSTGEVEAPAALPKSLDDFPDDVPL